MLLLVMVMVLVPPAQAAGYDEVVFGHGLNFDGVNDIVDVGDLDTLDGVSQYTIEAWVNFNSFAADETVFAKRTSDTDRAVVLQLANNTGALRIAVSKRYGTSTTTLSLNTWYHIAIVYDGTQGSDATRLKLYVDGALQSLTFLGTDPMVLSTTPAGSSSRLTLGAEYNSTVAVSGSAGVGVPFDGTLDDFRLWTVARTASEISMNKDVQLVGTESNLAVYYNFNQGTGTGSNPGVTTSNDSAGITQNGTLWNFALSGTSSNWVGLLSNAPSGLTATAASTTQINLAWTDNSLDETGFKVYRNGTLVTTTAADKITYNDTGLTCGTTYNYQVKATNGSGDSTAATASGTTSACSWGGGKGVGGVAEVIAVPTASSGLSYLAGMAGLVMLMGAGWLLKR